MVTAVAESVTKDGSVFQTHAPARVVYRMSVFCVGVCMQADFTPLMFCAYHGHALVAEVLIEAGCDVNASASV